MAKAKLTVTVDGIGTFTRETARKYEYVVLVANVKAEVLEAERIITANAAGWLVSTWWLNQIDYWTNLSTTQVVSFPFHLIDRVAGRADYSVHVRSILREGAQ